MVPVTLEEQLLPDTLEFAIHYLVDRYVDTSIFEHFYDNDDTGCPAYDPKVLLKIVLCGYSHGIISSRKIERACHENIVFIALACGQTPDHTTIANFISKMKNEIVTIFRNILLVCEEQGLLKGTYLAIDGIKLPGNASKRWSGTFSELQAKKEKIEHKIKKIIAEHLEHDRDDDDQDWSEKSKALKKVERLEKDLKKIQNFLQTQKPKAGHKIDETKSNLTDNDSVMMMTSHGTIQGYNSQLIADSYCNVIVECQAIGRNNDTDNLPPLIDGLKQNYQAIGLDPSKIQDKKLLADPAYFSTENLRKCDQEKLDHYIPDIHFRQRQDRYRDGKEPKFSVVDFTDQDNGKFLTCPAGKKLKIITHKRKKGRSYFKRYKSNPNDCLPCPFRHRCLDMKNAKSKNVYIHADSHDASLVKQAIQKIDSPKGQHHYDHRMGIAEPIFANIRTQKRLDRFTLRGHAKVNIQWRLYCLVHNIEKILHFGSIPAVA